MSEALDPQCLIAAAALGVAEAGGSEVEVVRLMARLMIAAGMNTNVEVAAVAASVPAVRVQPAPRTASFQTVYSALERMKMVLATTDE